MISLASRCTVARMLERDDFEKRYNSKLPISIHEFLYPLIQGYDSVYVKADVELGGTDQKFNLLMGRELQKQHGQTPQCVITMPILEGLDGVQKMSKSLNNYIGITEPADQMYGKIMSVSDELMWRYFELLSFKSVIEIDRLKNMVADGENPRNVKDMLAQEIVARFYDDKSASEAAIEFVQRFRNNQVPQNLPLQELLVEEGGEQIARLIKNLGLTSSTSESIRMINQGAVKIDGSKISDPKLMLQAGKKHLIQVGKRKFASIVIKTS